MKTYIQLSLLYAILTLHIFNIDLTGKIAYKLAKFDVLQYPFLIYLCLVKRCKIQIMKKAITNIKKILVTVTMLTAMLGNANGISSFIIKEDLKGTALTITNVEEGDLLSIKNYKGIIIYKETIQLSGSYENGYDLTQLPNGDYFFEIDKDLEIKTIPFSVENNKVAFKKDKEAVIFKPYVEERNNLIYITKFAPNHEPLKISIYGKYNDGTFELLHSEKVEGELSIERLYKLKEGSFKIVLNANDKIYTKFIIH